MRIIGHRKPAPITANPSGAALAAGARFAEAIAAIAPSMLVAKGVIRFPTHEAANAADADAITRAMVALHRKRVSAPEHR